MPLQIDFTSDVAARCLKRLTEAGYTSTPADDKDAIYTYVSVRHRRVRPRVRAVHKALYLVPPHMAAEEQQFLEKVAAGGNLWPHQSRKIGKTLAVDGMLNDFGIQHFHLGKAPDTKRPNLVVGTKELLFAIVREDDFYAIGIYDHDAWTAREVVDVVHATWPELTEPYTLQFSRGQELADQAPDLTDEQYATLRAKNANAFQRRPDGQIQMGMGGGVMSNGSSFVVRWETDRFVDQIEQLQARVEDALLEQVEVCRLSDDARVQLSWDDEDIYAVTDPVGFQVKLSGLLEVPPL